MKGKRKIMFPIFLSVLLITVLFLPGCGSENNNNTPDEEDFTFDDEIVLGYSGPLSGPGAIYGTGIFDALLMAAEDANALGGVVIDDVRYEIRVEGLDDEYRPDLAATNASRLIDQYDISTLFVPHAGGILAVMEFNQDENLLIAANTTFDLIVQLGNELVLRLVPNMASYYVPMAEWAYDQGHRTVALLPADNLYGITWRDGFKEKFEELGGEVVYNAELDYGSVDFYGNLSPALSEDPDAMLVIGPSEPSAVLVSQARELGYEGAFVFGEQAMIDEMAEIIGLTPLSNSIGLAPAGRTPYTNEVQEDFSQRFLDKYSQYNVVTSTHQIHYEALFYTIKAMEEAGTIDDARAIRAAVPNTLPVAQHTAVRAAVADDGSVLGISAIMEIDENGQFGDSHLIDYAEGYNIDFANIVPWTQRTEPSPWRIEFEKQFIQD